jgi:signal transduction histidine kinase
MRVKTLKASGAGLFRSHPHVKTQVLPARTNGNLCAGSKRFTMSYNTGSVVESGTHLTEVFWTLVKEGIRLMNVSNFALAVYNDHTGNLAFPWVFYQGERAQPFSVKLSHDQGLVSHVLFSRIPLLIQDLSKTGIEVKTDPICSDQPIRSWLSVPICSPVLTREMAQGVIIVWSHQPNAFTERHLRLLSALGAQAAAVLRNTWPRRTGDACLESLPVEREQTIEDGKRARRALARDLHDGPIQLVSALAMRLDFCRKVLEKDPTLLPEQITRMQELAERAIYQMRTMLFELRPVVLETQGLGAALRVLVERRQEVVKTPRLSFDLETHRPSGEMTRQDTRTEVAIFAIVQEAVNNALRHAQAGHIEVRLKETPTAIYITVVDDGKGFDMDTVIRSYEGQGSLGMISIRERAELIGGKLDIESVLNQGTRITVSVPIKNRFFPGAGA